MSDCLHPGPSHLQTGAAPGPSLSVRLVQPPDLHCVRLVHPDLHCPSDWCTPGTSSQHYQNLAVQWFVSRTLQLCQDCDASPGRVHVCQTGAAPDLTASDRLQPPDRSAGSDWCSPRTFNCHQTGLPAPGPSLCQTCSPGPSLTPRDWCTAGPCHCYRTGAAPDLRLYQTGLPSHPDRRRFRLLSDCG